MSTPDDTAQTWRDVADQLTATQNAQLERLVRDEPQTLLEMAQQWAAKNVADAAPVDHVAQPVGAVRTFDWQFDSDWFRDFEGTTLAPGRPAFRSTVDSRPTARRGAGSPSMLATWTRWNRWWPANWEERLPTRPTRSSGSGESTKADSLRHDPDVITQLTRCEPTSHCTK